MSLEQGNFQARGCDQWGKGGRGCGYGLRPSSRQPPKRGRAAPSRGYSQPTGPCHSARPSPGPATQTCPPDPGHSHESPVPRLFCKELQVSVMEKKKKKYTLIIVPLENPKQQGEKELLMAHPTTVLVDARGRSAPRGQSPLRISKPH